MTLEFQEWLWLVTPSERISPVGDMQHAKNVRRGTRRALTLVHVRLPRYVDFNAQKRFYVPWSTWVTQARFSVS